MKIALCQSPPTDGDTDAAFARLAQALAGAAQAGAVHLVAPELFLPGYHRPDLQSARAQPRGGPWEDRLAGMAAQSGCGLTVGWAERDGDAIYNAATCFDRHGTRLAHYRKRQLFGPKEKAVFTPGDDVPVFDLEGHRTALLICYDVEFADLVQFVAGQGVSLLLVPTANPAGFETVQDFLIPARACETGLTIVYANYCGAEDGLAYGGRSLIAGPDGRPLASAGLTETLLVTTLPTAAERARMAIGTQAEDRRPLPGAAPGAG